jgi:hypothetical protein
MDLVSVLREIYASEIDVTLRSRWDIGWQLEIEDGQVARAIVTSLDEAAPWFHEQVLIHYQNSLYSRTARGENRQALPKNATVRQFNSN